MECNKPPGYSYISSYSSGKCRCSICREAWKKYRKPVQRERSEGRLKVLRRYKMWKGCKTCGYKEHYAALTFDHRDPKDKLFSITQRLASISWEKIKAEVEKCDILCFNCHMIKTHIKGEGKTNET